MTEKQELFTKDIMKYARFNEIRKALDHAEQFFEQYICIHKGKNRHENADVLHEWAEDTTKKLQHNYDNNKWIDSICNKMTYRINPSEPRYEWMWYNENGNTIWWTIEESSNYVGECTYFRADQTKRERK
jgi:hypothetical protein